MSLYQLNKEQIFWKVVNYIQECSDTRITNEAGITTHTGMAMNDNYYILFGHDTGEIHIFDNEKEITSFNENSEILYSFALIFEDLITDHMNKKSPQTAGTECEGYEIEILLRVIEQGVQSILIRDNYIRTLLAIQFLSIIFLLFKWFFNNGIYYSS